ncbi:UDP-N-acetylenolpyruvoylglucosamine reductase [hydrothermal vent metagenome]|uniref:UDP-N-acetylmuramate dehydrogenase n=1 Tax=hydrothermal vent metagenome TaxID=652676 RepID=A0A3B0XR41_9ZZZZ
MMTAPDTQRIRGRLLYNEPMYKHTSWRVGGNADQFYTPADIEDLALFISSLPVSEAVLFIGLGSNLLVRDEGIRGTVISLKGSLSEIETAESSRGIKNNSGDIYLKAGAGVSCAKLARYCQRNDLLGGEFFAGIPGLMGGALAMNAGAFGGETWSFVQSVVTVDMQGTIHRRMADEYVIAYRSVTGKGREWFVSADLKFKKGSGDEPAARVRGLLEVRNKTQPIGLPSCGSVFKNPENDYAARLIEACGLKGAVMGGAVVSEKHANFIINTGDAKASDIEQLIRHVQKTVKEEQGVDLQTEVKVVGGAE